MSQINLNAMHTGLIQPQPGALSQGMSPGADLNFLAILGNLLSNLLSNLQESKESQETGEIGIKQPIMECEVMPEEMVDLSPKELIDLSPKELIDLSAREHVDCFMEDALSKQIPCSVFDVMSAQLPKKSEIIEGSGMQVNIEHNPQTIDPLTISHIKPYGNHNNISSEVEINILSNQKEHLEDIVPKVQEIHPKIEPITVYGIQEAEFLEVLPVTVKPSDVSFHYDNQRKIAQLSKNNIVNQVMLKFKSLENNGKITHMQLNPPNLGPLELVMKTEKNNTHVTLTAGQWDGYVAISRNIEELKTCIANSLPNQESLSLDLNLKEQFGESSKQEKEEIKDEQMHSEVEEKINSDDSEVVYDNFYVLNVINYNYRVNGVDIIV